MKSIKIVSSALFLLLSGALSVIGQEVPKLRVVSFSEDVFDLSARDERFKKVDPSGALYAIIKVSGDEGDNLREYLFNFGNMNHLTEEHDDQLWVYVQKSAKQVTITREGCAPLRNYDLRTTIESGKTYRMQLSALGTAISTQMVMFEVEPADARVTIMAKGSAADAEEQILGVTDAAGLLLKNMPLDTYTYRIASVSYYPSEGRFTLNDRSKTHSEKITLRPYSSQITLSVDGGAEIWVNGEKKGVGSWTGPLISGTCQVECRQQNHLSSTRSITVGENDVRTIELTPPTPITGALHVKSTPAGAGIKIDGKDYGTTPSDINGLLIGQHEVTLILSGFAVTKATVEVQENGAAGLNVALSDTGTVYREAMDLYEKKEYQQAISEFQRLAPQGHAESQYYLALCYVVITKNIIEAESWFEKAANQGHAGAQVELGNLYYNGTGIAQNYDKAVYWFEKAANQGNAPAQNNLGVCYSLGHGVMKDIQKAVSWYEKAANQDYAKAQYHLGILYYYGFGVENDYQKAFYWYEKAANQGYAEAQCNLGLCYENGHGVEKDLNKAVSLYEKAANQDNAIAQYNLGLSYMNGWGVEKDYQKAFYWYEKSANQGNAAAQYNLGVCYQKGYGVEKDLLKAVNLYEKSANQGYASAQCDLGYCYQNGQGVQQDLHKAFYWYEKSANQGNAIAQNNLGCLYEAGLGVGMDYQKAFYWFEKAANQGNAGAQYTLGVFYENGKGVSKDLKKAYFWYEKSASQGNAKAQSKLSNRK